MDFPVDVFRNVVIAQHDPHTLAGWKVSIDFHPTGKSVGYFRPRLTQLNIIQITRANLNVEIDCSADDTLYRAIACIFGQTQNTTILATGSIRHNTILNCR